MHHFIALTWRCCDCDRRTTLQHKPFGNIPKLFCRTDPCASDRTLTLGLDDHLVPNRCKLNCNAFCCFYRIQRQPLLNKVCRTTIRTIYLCSNTPLLHTVTVGRCRSKGDRGASVNMVSSFETRIFLALPLSCCGQGTVCTSSFFISVGIHHREGNSIFVQLHKGRHDIHASMHTIDRKGFSTLRVLGSLLLSIAAHALKLIAWLLLDDHTENRCLRHRGIRRIYLCVCSVLLDRNGSRKISCLCHLCAIEHLLHCHPIGVWRFAVNRQVQTV